MPYTTEHKQRTRERIVESARELFNRRGFAEVSIDDIMAGAGLTRGGFYNHFKTKEDLFLEVIEDWERVNPTDRWDGVELDLEKVDEHTPSQFIDAYLSSQHLQDRACHCPLAALSSDVAQASPRLRAAYAKHVERMASVFTVATAEPTGSTPEQVRARALGLAAMCVGGMTIARTVEQAELAERLRDSVRQTAHELLEHVRKPSNGAR